MYLAFYFQSWSGSKEADYFIEYIDANNLDEATEKWQSEHSEEGLTLVKIHHFFPGRSILFGVQDQDEFRFTDRFFPG